MHALFPPVLRLASVGLFALPHSAFALPLAALPGAALEINQPDIQPVCGGGRHWVEDKVASLEPFIEKSLEDDDEPEEEHGTSKFERSVKGRMPLPPVTQGIS